MSCLTYCTREEFEREKDKLIRELTDYICQAADFPKRQVFKTALMWRRYSCHISIFPHTPYWLKELEEYARNI